MCREPILDLFYSLLGLQRKARQLSQYPDDIRVIIYRGNRVRLVETYSGCIATEGHKPQEGVVIGFETITNPSALSYPKFRENLIAQIKLDTGKIIKRPAVPREWCMFDGLPEHRR